MWLNNVKFIRVRGLRNTSRNKEANDLRPRKLLTQHSLSRFEMCPCCEYIIENADDLRRRYQCCSINLVILGELHRTWTPQKLVSRGRALPSAL